MNFKKEKERVETEITHLTNNFKLINLESKTAKLLEAQIDDLTDQLRAIEEKEKRIPLDSNLNDEDLKLIRSILCNIKDFWQRIPPDLKSRLFKSLLQRIIIKPVENDDFLVEIQWQQGNIDTLWIERPPMSSRCKSWPETDKQLLVERYSQSSVIDLINLFPGKNLDAIREMASRLGLHREAGIHYPWGENDDRILKCFCNKKITYKQMRRALPYHYQADIRRRAQKLGLKWPEVNKINWRVVNTLENGGDRPTRYDACCRCR